MYKAKNPTFQIEVRKSAGILGSSKTVRETWEFEEVPAGHPIALLGNIFPDPRRFDMGGAHWGFYVGVQFVAPMSGSMSYFRIWADIIGCGLCYVDWPGVNPGGWAYSREWLNRVHPEELNPEIVAPNHRSIEEARAEWFHLLASKEEQLVPYPFWLRGFLQRDGVPVCLKLSKIE